MMLLLMGAMKLAEEGHVDLAEHVEDGHRGADQQKAPHHRVTVCERLPDDFVLGHKARERRYARERQGCDYERREGDRHVMTQTTHLAHVLFAAHRVNDRP